jgi:hypothetical protein
LGYILGTFFKNASGHPAWLYQKRKNSGSRSYLVSSLCSFLFQLTQELKDFLTVSNLPPQPASTEDQPVSEPVNPGGSSKPCDQNSNRVTKDDEAVAAIS